MRVRNSEQHQRKLLSAPIAGSPQHHQNQESVHSKNKGKMSDCYRVFQLWGPEGLHEEPKGDREEDTGIGNHQHP